MINNVIYIKDKKQKNKKLDKFRQTSANFGNLFCANDNNRLPPAEKIHVFKHLKSIYDFRHI